MSPRSKALVSVLTILVILVIIAHIPGPAPTAQAVANVEKDPAFQTMIIPKDAYTYAYQGYTDNPRWALDNCVTSVFAGPMHTFFPFQTEYATTTLIFLVQPNMTTIDELRNSSGIAVVATEGDLVVKINPTSGHIYDIFFQGICA